MQKMKVMISGIGGASFGTEFMKCLANTEDYTIFGCDISHFAFGHYMSEIYNLWS